MNKEHIYHQNIQRSLMELYDHMSNNLLSWMPDDGDFDFDHITQDQQETIHAVNAIEEEWILNEQDRKEASMIQWYDD